MSYGVMGSKTGQLLVETTSGSGGSESDLALDRFESVWGPAWVPGRVTVTRLHLNFIPNRAGRGMAMLDLNLRDITAVELSGGRVTKSVGLRLERHLVRVRCLGAPSLAQQITELVQQSQRPAPRRRSVRM